MDEIFAQNKLDIFEENGLMKFFTVDVGFIKYIKPKKYSKSKNSIRLEVFLSIIHKKNILFIIKLFIKRNTKYQKNKQKIMKTKDNSINKTFLYI